MVFEFTNLTLQLCFSVTGNFKGLCKQIDHFPEDTDYEADASEYFLRECLLSVSVTVFMFSPSCSFLFNLWGISSSTRYAIFAQVLLLLKQKGKNVTYMYKVQKFGEGYYQACRTLQIYHYSKSYMYYWLIVKSSIKIVLLLK